MSTILVTGGAGFIGSHLVDALVKRKHRVVVVDDLSVGKRSHVHPQARFIKYSVAGQALARMLRPYRFSHVYHLAAQKNLQVSKRFPVADATTNIIGTLQCIQIAAQSRAKLIFYSTAAVYDPSASPPSRESECAAPVTPYGIAKYAAELYIRQSGLRYSILRLSNVYGPRQDAYGEGGVVAIFSDRLARGKICTIFNTGRQTRDFVYVTDVVSASLMALSRGTNQVVNISTGIETTVLRLYRALEKISGRNQPVRRGQVVEQYRSALGNIRARTILKWRPRITMEQGLRTTYQWFITK
ncbi:MAG: NAD-dependent epimerase/dehydratase family protein [Patescibacteria group bacterium]